MKLEELEKRLLLTTLRVASWNTANNPDNAVEDQTFETVLQAIGDETVEGNTTRLGLLAVQETDERVSVGDSIRRIESVLEDIYAGVDYGVAVTSRDGGGDSTGFVYDTSMLSLLETSELNVGFTHNTLRGKFRPTGTLGQSDFYVYTTHLKAGSTTSDRATRAGEADLIRADLDSLGEGTQAIVAGDFNVRSSFETSFVNLVAVGAGQLVDPVAAPGDWHDNASFSSLHTQNPQDPANGGGGVDDRFDFQLATGELFDGFGIDYIDGSYHAFGNNGTHALNGSITTGTGASPEVLSALAAASDHLPVVADYEIFNSPNVVIEQTGGGTSVSESGQSDEYSLRLTTVPTANVTVTVSSNDQLDLGAGPGNPVSLTFPPGNATTRQAITVRAVNDTLIEGDHFSAIGHSVSSLDSDYDGFAPGTIQVEIEDNDETEASIVITEIMYNPDTEETSPGVGEWIEIVNDGNFPVDLGGWTIDDEDNTNWSAIPAGMILNPRQVAVFFDEDFATEAEFRSDWQVPASSLVIGLSWGSLANSPSATSEILQLVDTASTIADQVNYDDSGDWPSDSTDGPSIHLVGVELDNDVGTAWARSIAGVDDAISPVGALYSTTDAGSPGRFFDAVVSGNFDGDGDFDCTDIDALVSAISSASNNLVYDLTADGIVNTDDLDQWLIEAGANNLATGGAYLEGDANLDGFVDGSDFNIWNANRFATDRGWCGGDFNADGATDGSDFNMWNANRFSSSDAVAIQFDSTSFLPDSHDSADERIAARKAIVDLIFGSADA